MLVGYVDRLVARPGDTIRLHASGTGEPVQVRVVRFRGTPGRIDSTCGIEPVAALCDRLHLHTQTIPAGSYGVLPESLCAQLGERGGFSFWFLPTLALDTDQVLLACGRAVDVRWRKDHALTITVGEVSLGTIDAVRTGEWHFLAVGWSRTQARVSALLGRRRDPYTAFEPYDMTSGWQVSANWLAAGCWSLAAQLSELCARNHFNGKIARLTFHSDPLSCLSLATLAKGCTRPLARYAFEHEMHSSRLVDLAGAAHGALFQQPTRGVTGPHWTGEHVDPARSPQHYDAIHFHEDDLTDAQWPAVAKWRIPEDCASGIYGISLESASGVRDVVPFFVAPPLEHAARPPIAVLFPTLSYLAYANEQLVNVASDLFTHQNPSSSIAAYRYIAEQRLFSLYDRHRDGSGYCYASLRRPLLNVRHDHGTMLLGGSPHQFSADLHLAAWLDGIEQRFDALTDELLDADGAALLAPYRVVLTGTHPEYWTAAMLRAARSYLEGGGRLMYMGANGFYWVTALSQDRSCIEIRRVDGNRAWQAGPGEAHLSLSGEYGGLWRTRGQAPQRLTGVGFTAQGFDCNRPYERSDRSYQHDVAWVFDGVSERTFGDQPNTVLSHGAAGFEIDRADPALGSPAETVVLATATGFSDAYQLGVEDVLVSDSRQSGSINPLVRADLTLLPYPQGGAVFSTSSIAWCGALAQEGGDNPIARITLNVLRRFLSDGPVLDP
jgi:N,N-dimethylformamidase